MNTIYYAKPSTGERAAVKVGQPSYALICEAYNRRWSRRPTMAEADAAMRKKGFVRWSRRKAIPGFQEVRLPRAA